jgi:hypothetical protein
MTEAIKAISYLLDKLAGGTEIHCDVFRHIYGMKPGTAERRLRDYRDMFAGQVFEGMTLYKPGYVAHRAKHIWTFTRPFLRFLAQQVAAAKKLERQNEKV